MNGRIEQARGGAMRIKIEHRNLVVGDESQYDELVSVIDLIKDEAAVENHIPIHAFTVPVTVTTLAKDVDGRGTDDFISLVTFVTGREGDERMYSFMGYLKGNKDDGAWPSADRLKSAILICAADRDGCKPAIVDVEIARGAGLSGVKFRVWNGKRFVKRTAKKFNATDAIAILFELSKRLFNRIGYMFAIQGARFSKGSRADIYASDVGLSFYHLLSFVFSAANGAGKKFPSSVKKVLLENARRTLLMSEADSQRSSRLVSTSQGLLMEKINKLRWKGKPLGRFDYYNLLENSRSPKERSGLAKHYSAAVIDAYKQKGGLFSIIGELNSICKNYDYDGVPEYVSEVDYNFKIGELDDLMNRVRSGRGAELYQTINILEDLNGKAVCEWDVPHLFSKLLRENTGWKRLPTIGADDAIGIARRFFKDIGFDFDRAPLEGNVFFDINRREDKYKNAFALGLGDGSRGWFNADFRPGQPLCLTDLETIIHELTHIAHGILGAKNNSGSAQMTAIRSQPLAFSEGIAIALQEMVYEPGFVKRYLSHLKCFKSRRACEGLVDTQCRKLLYEAMKVMIRARQEVELYRGAIEKKFVPLAQLVTEYLHVESDVKRLDFWSIPHPSGMPMYYPNYSMGREVAGVATAPIRDALNGKGRLSSSSGMLAKIFEQGPKLRTLKEISDFISV